MSELVPRFLLERMAQGHDRGGLPGAAVYVDIVGFTALGDSMARFGPHGAEVVAGVVQSVMIPIVESVHRAGGFVASFPGDAVHALFPSTLFPSTLFPSTPFPPTPFPSTPFPSTPFPSTPFPSPPVGAGSDARAVAAAHAIQGAIRAVGVRVTPYGTFDIAARVGVGAGELQWAVLRAGQTSRRAYVFGGSAPAHAVAAEGSAGPGEVVIHESVEGGVGTVGTAMEGPVPTTADLSALSRGFVGPDLVADLGAGEFRPITSVFVKVAEESLDEIVADVLLLQDRHGGHLDPIEIGDKGCVVRLVWGAPVRHEGDYERPLRFVDALRRRHPEVRVGITAGTAFTGFVGTRDRMGYITYGSHVNLAARLMSTAGPGQVLVSDEVAAQARPLYALQGVGRHRLKGFSRPVRVHALLGPSPARRARRGFVGRSRELAALEEFLVAATGVAVVHGPPGIGKSALVAEARQRVRGVRWIAAAADPVWRGALQPFREIAAEVLQQSAQEDRATHERRFEESVAELGLAEHRVYLGALVDLFWPSSPYWDADPIVRRQGVLDALRALVRALCARQPLVLQIDDLHWSDRETIAFLPELLDVLADLPFTLVVTSRQTEYLGRTPTLDLTLGELAGSDLAALGRRVLGEPLAPQTVDWLAGRTAGNPFFAKQVLLHLHEGGRLLPSPAGLVLAAGAASVPPSVGAVVVARLDGLPADLRRAVKCASVLGGRADVGELRELLVRDGLVAPDLDSLSERAAQAGVWRTGERTVEFTHALVRDAAYDTLLLATRRRLHGAAAELIEQRYAGALGPHLHRLARHHAGAGALSRARLRERAAADRALGLGAYHEAGDCAESGLAIGTAADGEELGLWLALAASRMITDGQGAASTKDAYDHAAALASEAAETRAGFRALFGLRTFYLFQGDHRHSLELALRSMQIAERIGDPDLVAQAHLMVGNAQFWVGALESALGHLQVVLEPSATGPRDPDEPAAHRTEFVQDPRFTAVFPAAMARWLRGDRAGASRLAQVALAEAADAFSVATVLQTVGFLHCLDGNARRAFDIGSRLVELARENKYPVYVGIGSFQLGWAQAHLGAVEDGLALMLDTLTSMRAGGTVVGSTLMGALAAEAHLAAGRADAGRAIAAEALADATERHELAFAGLLSALRDELRDDLRDRRRTRA